MQKRTLEEQVWEYICAHRMLQEGDRVVAGVSGGADSVCLLLLLRDFQRRLDFRLYAVHVEHGIRGAEALEDAAFVQELCERWQVPLRLVHADVPALARREGLSLEEAGRRVRYEAFAGGCDAWGGTKIAVAHHRKDQAETLLLNLLRGTGLKGMGGMAPVQGRIVRPLLSTGREEIEEWLVERGEEWRTDATNLEETYARNRVRLQILPEAQKINQRAVEHLAAACEAAREAEDYLEERARQLLEQGISRMAGRPVDTVSVVDAVNAESAVDAENAEAAVGVGEPREVVLDTGVLAAEAPLMRKYVLRELLRCAGVPQKDLTSVHMEALLDLSGAQTGKELTLPGGGYARKTARGIAAGMRESNMTRGIAVEGREPCAGVPGDARDVLLTVPGSVRTPDGICVTLHMEILEKEQEIPIKTYTKWLDYDKIKGDLRLRKRQPGDYLLVNAAGGRKKLKDYFIDEKIDRTQRDGIWLLAEGSHILWVLGYRISEDCRITGQTKRILKIQADGGKYHE